MRLAVIGLGFMGSTHLKALQKIPGAQLAAVVSHDSKKLDGDLSAIQGNIGGPGETMDFSAVKKYRTFEEALGDPDIDAVDLCLPTHLHCPVAVQALEAGKHVLVEKPMALNGDETERMMNAAAKADRVLMTAQVLRFWPEYRVMADAVKSSRLGAVRSAVFRRRCAAPSWNKWLQSKENSGGGAFDLLIHDVDMCIHLFGAPHSISATGHEDLEHGIDAVTAQFHYRGVGSVTITGGWHHPKAYPFSMEYTVIADGGTMEYSSAGKAPTLYRADGEAEALTLPQQDAFQAELEYFVECCRDGKKPELCPPAESSLAVQLTNLMVEARKDKGEKIECRL